MTEGQESTAASASAASQQPECLCGNIRRAFREAANMFLPPESAAKHFRQAQVEVWRGIRELVDLRIEHLSREPNKGTRVVVE